MNKKENQNRQQQNEFIAMLQKCINAYDEADKLYDDVEDFVKNKMPTETSFYDSEQQDYLHIFEDYDLTDKQLISVGKAMVNNRDNRRNWHNIYKIAEVWNEHKNKIINRNSRIFLRENISKVINNLDLQWKYRKLSEEDILKLLKDSEDDEKKKQKGGRRSFITDELISTVKILKAKGFKVSQIHQQTKLGTSTIYQICNGTYRSA